MFQCFVAIDVKQLYTFYNKCLKWNMLSPSRSLLLSIKSSPAILQNRQCKHFITCTMYRSLLNEDKYLLLWYDFSLLLDYWPSTELVNNYVVYLSKKKKRQNNIKTNFTYFIYYFNSLTGCPLMCRKKGLWMSRTQLLKGVSTPRFLPLPTTRLTTQLTPVPFPAGSGPTGQQLRVAENINWMWQAFLMSYC